MNITIIGWRDITHSQAGGAENYITKVAESFVEHGHKVCFLTARESGQKKQETINGVEYIRSGNRFSIYVQLPLLFLQRYKKNTDLLIEHYNAWPFLGPLLTRKTIAVMYHVQTEEWVAEFGQITGRVLSLISRMLLAFIYRNTRIVTISRSSLKDITALGISEQNIKIVPVGIPDNLIDKKRVSKDSKSINLITIGRLKKHKRVDLIIKTLAAIKGKLNKTVKLYVLGKGDQEEELKKLARDLKVRKMVTFCGYVDEETKRNFLDHAHLNLQFSQREGWGITIIEAAARGVPSVGFTVPGLVDSITPETGYLIENEADIESALLKILTDIENQNEIYLSKSERGIEFARKFKWNDLLEYWNLYISK